MRIISPFRDYYDRIANQYGGGDPKVTYVRPVNGPYSAEIPSKIPSPIVPDFNLAVKEFIGDSREYNILSVAGRGWLMITDSRTKASRIIDPPDEAFGFTVNAKGKRVRNWGGKHRVFVTLSNFEIGVENPWLVEISKSLSKQRPVPVFSISGFDRRNEWLTLTERTPRLADVGLPSILPPEHVYQEIAYFIGNVLTQTPDTRPPVDIDNKHKILAAGFDLKQSFRHRM